MAAGTGSPRERYRSQVRAEIKELAWKQIAVAGASGLSLNAIAKELGMSGPALYRYYAGRDELITELIRDAYRGLADAMRTAVAEPESGIADLARALRRWALADPQRYFLVYGTPVPGYHAPGDITGIAREIMSALLDVCADAQAVAGAPDAFDAHLVDHRQWAGDHQATPAALHRALAFWTRLHGLISLELAGHFAGMGFDPELFFTTEVERLVAGR
ncbi:TetR/AcrR family transcriptional regulator [Streptomyces sp. NPDC086787]|uniref:TetR/AcrR family transcriptional regulator n=1 Tax=Streptomyces sp. NPDC086787 TaxID=3365759 RepID=UPI0037F9AA94